MSVPRTSFRPARLRRWLFPAALLAALHATAGFGAGLEVKPGDVTEFEATLSPAQREMASAGGAGNHATTLAAVAVPKDFDPGRPWPVLVVSATSDLGYNSSRKNLHWFMTPALRAGWVLVAADPTQHVDPALDSNGMRYGLALAAMDRLEQQWPNFRRWPRAFAGISGGAKRSAWLAALSALDGYRPLGVLQCGCNQAVMIDALSVYRPDRAKFLAVPVYLSSGSDDAIATPAQMLQVDLDLESAGFRHVRLEKFPGKHAVYPYHVEQALRWFLEIAAKGG